MSEWISIEDQIPNEHEPVIISGWNFNDKEKGRYVEPAVRVGMDFWPPFERDEGFIKILLMEGEPFHQPTHWMPLPAAPGDTAQPDDAAQESPEDLVVWRITMPSGEVCHFGTEAMAKAWGRGSGKVERIELKARPALEMVAAEQPDTVKVPRELLKEAADEIAHLDRQWRGDDAMGLRMTPPRASRLMDKLRSLLGKEGE